MRGTKVLVTGAGGFIGSHLTEALVKLGAEVRVFIRYNSRGSRGWIDTMPKEIQTELEICLGDLRDQYSVFRAVKGCQVVFHLGALIAIPYSYVNPSDFVQVNVLGTAHVLNACREYGVERMVHTSTSEVYGTARYVPIDEDHPFQGQSPYAASKIGADQLAESYFRSFGLPVAIIRPFNTYGPRQSARAVIPTIISQALADQEVWLGSLHPTRDLSYVDDVIRGFIMMAKSDRVVGKVINIGHGKEVSIGELAEKIVSLIGREVNITRDERRIRPEESEVERLLCDNRKAKAILGWKPKVSLEEGLKSTIEWIKANLGYYRVGEYVL